MTVDNRDTVSAPINQDTPENAMITRNTLFYGDNLPILRDLPADFVDLVYLDPPFNSNRNYNVLFRDESGNEADAQIEAFQDTWHWSAHTEHLYRQIVTQADEPVSRMIEAMRGFVGENQLMAYVVMLAARLVELHRVLKPTGSLYLHCDPTASHYLKVVLDTIFGAQNYRNEIVWKRQSAHSDAKTKFPDVTDTIFLYAKTNRATFTPIYGEHDKGYLSKNYRYDDNDGRGRYRLGDITSPNPRPNMIYEWLGFVAPAKGWRFQLETMKKLHEEGRIYYPKHTDGTLDTSKRPAVKRYIGESEGSIITNVWTDIVPLHSSDAERLGYPTQKPVAILERIVLASSNPGDLVLDPFCGCGTAVAAAQKLGRKWIGIDITHLSIALQKMRLKDSFGLLPGKDYDVHGEPVDYASAVQLAQDDRYQFQWWALSLIQARPIGTTGGGREGKKGADQGIDGVITFVDDASNKAKRAIVQVKSGGVNAAAIRDLIGTVQREGAPIGIFITLEQPSKPMLLEAARAGFYHSPGWKQDYPRIQILTIQDLLNGATVKMPPTSVTFKQAEKVDEQDDSQLGFRF